MAYMLIYNPATTPPLGVQVSNASDLRSAFAAGELDVSLMADISITSPIDWPALNATRTFRAFNGARIIANGTDQHWLRKTGSGGRYVLYDVHVDGGWTHNGEASSDSASNFWFPACVYLELVRCHTTRSRRTGVYATDCDTLIMRECSGYDLPRDMIYSTGSTNITFEDNTCEHCCDDFPGNHTIAGRPPRTLVLRRNTSDGDCLGIKTLGSNAIIEDNIIFAPQMYGIGLGYDGPEGPENPIENIIVRRNRIVDVNKTSLGHPGQVIGAGVRLIAPGRTISNVVIEDNEFVRTPVLQGMTYAEAYDRPEGKLSKNGFVAGATIDLGTVPVDILCSNPNAAVIQNNTLTGSGWGSIQRRTG